MPHSADGMRTLHGTHVHGFPNAFIVQITQGANLISNVPHNFTEGGKTVAMIVQHALEHGYDQVEVTKEAEDAWIDLLLSGPGMTLGSADCTPGYYNNEGKVDEGKTLTSEMYGGGSDEFFALLRAWRDAGTWEGLEID